MDGVGFYPSAEMQTTGLNYFGETYSFIDSSKTSINGSAVNQEKKMVVMSEVLIIK